VAITKFRVVLSLSLIAALFCSIEVQTAFGLDKEQVLRPRFPEDQIAKAKGMKNPLPADAALALGKRVYETKGTCVSCHGAGGKGDGELAESLTPPPRDFCDTSGFGWQEARSDGEIFMAIGKGTELGMIAFEDMLEEDEIWALVSYVRSFKKGGGAK